MYARNARTNSMLAHAHVVCTTCQVATSKEQSKELARLSGVQDAYDQATRELDAAVTELRKLRIGGGLAEEVHLCVGMITRAAQKELGIEVGCAGGSTEGGSLRGCLTELLAAYKAARADAADGYIRLESEAAALRSEFETARDAWEGERAEREAALSAASEAAARGEESSRRRTELECELESARGLAAEAAAEATRELEASRMREHAAVARVEVEVAGRARAEEEAAERSRRAEAAEVAAEAAEAAAEAARRELATMVQSKATEVQRLRDEVATLERGAAAAAEAEGPLRAELAAAEARLRAAEEALASARHRHEEREEAMALMETTLTQKLRQAEAAVEAAATGARAEAEAEREHVAKLREQSARVEEGLRARLAEVEAVVAQLELATAAASAEGAASAQRTAKEAEAARASLEVQNGELREALALKEAALNTAEEKLASWLAGRGDGVAEAYAELDTAKASLAQLTERLQRATEDGRAQFKAERAALVDHALKALSSLSAHLAYTLAGLRLGERGEACERPAALLTCSPAVAFGRAVEQAALKPSGSPPLQAAKGRVRWGHGSKEPRKEPARGVRAAHLLEVDAAEAEAARQKAAAAAEAHQRQFSRSVEHAQPGSGRGVTHQTGIAPSRSEASLRLPSLFPARRSMVAGH